MPYSRSSVHSNGYSSDIHPNTESPTYVLEHLATFTVSKENEILYPTDGMRRLLTLEKSNGIWSQKMHFRLDPNVVFIMDYETGVVMERFPVSMIQEPTAFTSNDPMEIYNNILVFIVGDDRQMSNSQAEMHIFQCQNISAENLAEHLKQLRNEHIIPNHAKPRHIPPPPPTPPPEPPMNGIKVRDQISAFNAAAHGRSGSGSAEFEARDDETSSTSSEKYERDVTVLNHCFDDIEKFIARLQHSVAASRELERRQKNRKSKKKDMGDGMLTMRAKPPAEVEFYDIFQKFKLSFNLLAKLKSHIHDPNAPELVHFLFTPLALIVDASHDMVHYGPNLPASVTTPLLTREAVNLLMNCVTSKETELWHSLGDAWLIPKEQWKGSVPPYHPVFMDSWTPNYPVDDNCGSASAEPITLGSDKRHLEEARSHRELPLRKIFWCDSCTNLSHRHDPVTMLNAHLFTQHLHKAFTCPSHQTTLGIVTVVAQQAYHCKRNNSTDKKMHPDLRESQYRDHGHDDSSDYFEYEQQGSDMATSAAPTLPLVGQYPYEGHSRHYSHNDSREICHSPDLGSDQDFVNVMPSHMHGGSRGERERDRDRDREAHSDISADSIERNGGISDRFERNQMRWLDELRNRDAKIVQVTYPRTANNDKELSVMRGEFLEVLDDSRKWWKTRNSRGIIAHVPHTIITPFTSMGESSEILANSMYNRNYDRGSRGSYLGKESVSLIEHDHPLGGPSGIASDRSRSARSPTTAPAEWVRKERLGKKGEFRYF